MAASDGKEEKSGAAEVKPPPKPSEAERVRRWRREYALHLGLTEVDAELFATTNEVSLSLLFHVVRELGATPDQAARALL